MNCNNCGKKRMNHQLIRTEAGSPSPNILFQEISELQTDVRHLQDVIKTQDSVISNQNEALRFYLETYPEVMREYSDLQAEKSSLMEILNQCLELLQNGKVNEAINRLRSIQHPDGHSNDTDS